MDFAFVECDVNNLKTTNDTQGHEAGNELIEQALARHGGKVKPAAEELGISERTIYRFLAKQRSSR